MTIKEIKSYREKEVQEATVTLTYDEIKDICTAMVHYVKCKNATKFKDEPKERVYRFFDTKRDMCILFELIKNGKLDQCTINRYAEIMDEVEEEYAD